MSAAISECRATSPFGAAAAKAAHAEAARDEAHRRLQLHEAQTRLDKQQIAALEEELRAHHMAVALEETSVPEAPNISDMENLRAKVAVADQIAKQLEARWSAADQEFLRARSAHNDAIAGWLKESALQPALAELEDAFDQVRAAAVKVMASHHLVHRKFNDRAPIPNNALELYGPVAELLFALRQMDWPDYPYDIRPGWLPRHGTFWPDEMVGVHTQVQKLLGECGE